MCNMKKGGRFVNNRIYCSTGCVIAPDNLWNEELIVSVCRDINADGFELMTVKPFYEKLSRVVSAVERSGLSFPIIHLEKDIAVYLASDDDDEAKKGLELFKTCCTLGKNIGAERAVFHFWSGRVSDTRLENNLRYLDILYNTALEHGLLLMIENVPCVKYDPITNLKKISEKRADARFVYDTRFGEFHRQNEIMLKSDWIKGKDLNGARIDHVHVSGYRGGEEKDFTSLRPILHLDEGVTDHKRLLEKLSSVYFGSITCEAPAVVSGGIDTDAINRDLELIRACTKYLN